jgi:hypothetical protein
MRAPVAAAACLAVVAIAAVGLAWLQDVPEISAHDAVRAAEHAFQRAGLDATVEGDPVRAVYASRSHDPVDVWAVQATVQTGSGSTEPVQLRLARAGAQPVSIDDRSLDGSAYVLSDDEYATVAGNVDDPARARTVRRNIVLTIAAALVVALALVHAATTAASKRGSA